MEARKILTGLAKLVAVLVAGVVVGGGIGLGLSELTSDDPVAVSTAAPAAPEPRAEVLSADLLEASTFSGRSRDRARISVRLRIANDTDAPLTTQRPALVVEAGRTLADPAADEFAGALLGDIAPAETVTGLLRFETAGEVTVQLREGERATVEIAGLDVPVTIAD